VMDDGSTDGSAEMVQSEFPQVALYRFEESKGLIVRRNEAAHLAKGEIIFSIDDDAIFSTPDVINQTLAEFDSPRIGAVAIPYINVRKDSIVRQCTPDGRGPYLTDAYICTTHAVRRSVLLLI